MVDHANIDHTGLTGITGAGALTLIEAQDLGSDVASVTFSTIAGTYRDLQLRILADCDGSGNDRALLLRFNADSGANYGYLAVQDAADTSDVVTAGSVADYTGATSIVIGELNGASGAANHAAQAIIDIVGYAQTTWFKEAVALSTHRSSVAFRQRRASGLWESTAAITSITLLPSGGNFLTGSRFALYGVS